MADYTDLKQLGLSKTAIAVYETLYKGGLSTAGQLAKELNLSRGGIYKAIKQLEAWGFIEHLTFILPEVTRFRAVRLDKALENLAIYQRRAIIEITEEQIERSLRRLQGRYGRTDGRDWR